MQPKLRPVHVQPVIHYGEPAVALQDPLQLSGQVVIIPFRLTPLLPLCDGSRDINMLRVSLALRSNIYLTPNEMTQIVQRLDEALLLDNERFTQAQQQALAEYRAAPCRRPALAGLSYPADKDALRQYFDQLVASVAHDGPASSDARAVISPHIDYPRGGSVYAQTWARAAVAIAEADLAVVFGTDHNGSPGRITLTRQHYASPFGVSPTDSQVVDALVTAIGPEAAFAEELHHRHEHSVELTVIWLHYFLGGQRIPAVPILCGPLDHHIQNGSDPATDPVIAATVQTLRTVTAGRRVLWIAAADLAHVGPVFGDAEPLDLPMRARLRAADERLLQAIQAGDPAAFFQSVQAERDRWRVCGLAPIYLTLQMVAPATGTVVAYEHCPADAVNGSVVTIAGALLR